MSARRRLARLIEVARFAPAPRLAAVWRYLIPPVATLAVFLIQLGLFPRPGIAPFVFFYVAIAIASWLGGRIPGLLTVGLSAAVANYAFVEAGFGWAVSGPALTATGMFVTAGSLVALLCASFRESVFAAQVTARTLRLAEERVRQLNRSLQQRNADLEAERQRWQGVVEGIADEVWVCDAAGKTTLINQPEGTVMRFGELQGMGLDDILDEFEISLPDGRLRPPDQAPMRRSLRGEVVRGEEIMRRRSTGAVRFRQFSSAPLRDAAGVITGAVAVIRDVTELREASAERERLVEALREAHRHKDEFLAMLSHELRNPLAPIRNSLYLLDRLPAGDPRTQRARATIERQVEHLTRLIGDLLDVSRISRGKIQLERRRLDLWEVVERTIDDRRTLFSSRSIELSVEPSAGELWVLGDATRLAQVLGNLLDNAAKFTPGGGRVSVRASQESASALLTVEDTGVGISADMMPRIFEPFTQADRSLDRASGGLGLGLAVVKGLVELHGGEIHALSDGPGAGTSFTIRLPVEAGTPDRVPPRLEVVAARRRRVLVIEDNIDSAESLKEALELDEHEVAVAFTGPEGLATARAFSPDVVLCDIGLPGMNGYEVAHAFRADEELRHAHLVALTGYAGPDDQQRAARAGFDRHLAKPPDMDMIESVLAEAPDR